MSNKCVVALILSTIITLAFSSTAFAQDMAASGPSADGPKASVDVTKAMLDAAAKIGAAALKPGVSVSDRNIALSDIYYVISGHGTQVTGTMVDGIKTTASTTIGPGWSSKTPIKDGRSTTLGPGEMQVIPPGLGHAWSEIADGGITYMTIRVDPEHLLALSK
jgi:mannose-6-phosphate isomerase-like protein (cupin superfamily)